jgi:hypothetical protein
MSSPSGSRRRRKRKDKHKELPKRTPDRTKMLDESSGRVAVAPAEPKSKGNWFTQLFKSKQKRSDSVDSECESDSIEPAGETMLARSSGRADKKETVPTRSRDRIIFNENEDEDEDDEPARS